jgi:hypothetical protein
VQRNTAKPPLVDLSQTAALDNLVACFPTTVRKLCRHIFPMHLNRCREHGPPDAGIPHKSHQTFLFAGHGKWQKRQSGNAFCLHSLRGGRQAQGPLRECPASSGLGSQVIRLRAEALSKHGKTLCSSSVCFCTMSCSNSPSLKLNIRPCGNAVRLDDCRAVTVAILAQGTPLADAAKQAFLPSLQEP